MLFRYTENPLETGHFDPRGSTGCCLANGVYGKQFFSVHRRKGQPESLRRVLFGVLGPDRLGAGFRFRCHGRGSPVSGRRVLYSRCLPPSPTTMNGAQNMGWA